MTDIFVSRHKLTTAESLVDHLEGVNARLGQLNDKQWFGEEVDGEGMVHSATVAGLKKARINNFYLGLDKSWLVR